MAERLNVIVVVLDGARADHLSCYGYGRETTPFLDTVAREGVRFTHMVSTAPWTLPSHASLFTGLFATTHGATDEHRQLSRERATIAQVFKSAGYRTAAFCTNPWVSPATGFERGIDFFYNQVPGRTSIARATLYARHATDRVLRRGDSGARRTNQALLRWLQEGGEPFFVFLHYNESHMPFHPPPPYERLFLPRDVNAARAGSVNQDGGKLMAGRVEMSEEDFLIVRALYDGELRYIDDRLREIADFLAARGEWDRTVFVVTADHGESLGEHNLLGHRLSLHDTLLRVPLLIRCLSQVPQGYVVDEFAQTLDVFPTAAHFAELDDQMPRVQGRPLVCEGRATTGPTFAVAERFRPNLDRITRRFPDFDTRPFNVRRKAIRTKYEKYIWQSDEDNELYDLRVDPTEERNVISENPERAEGLRRQLFDWLAKTDRWTPGEENETDSLARRRVQASANAE